MNVGHISQRLFTNKPAPGSGEEAMNLNTHPFYPNRCMLPKNVTDGYNTREVKCCGIQYSFFGKLLFGNVTVECPLPIAHCPLHIPVGLGITKYVN